MNSITTLKHFNFTISHVAKFQFSFSLLIDVLKNKINKMLCEIHRYKPDILWRKRSMRLPCVSFLLATLLGKTN